MPVPTLGGTPCRPTSADLSGSERGACSCDVLGRTRSLSTTDGRVTAGLPTVARPPFRRGWDVYRHTYAQLRAQRERDQANSLAATASWCALAVAAVLQLVEAVVDPDGGAWTALRWPSPSPGSRPCSGAAWSGGARAGRRSRLGTRRSPGGSRRRYASSAGSEASIFLVRSLV